MTGKRTFTTRTASLIAEQLGLELHAKKSIPRPSKRIVRLDPNEIHSAHSPDACIYVDEDSKEFDAFK